MKRLLLVSNDRLGERMAGPAIRYYNFARELARTFDVTLMVPDAGGVEIEGVKIVKSNRYGPRAFREFAASFDALIAQNLRPWTMRALAETKLRVIYDLYDPYLVENLGFFAHYEGSRAFREVEYRANALLQEIALATGDAFVCASDRQRDFWLGMLGALGRVDTTQYTRDPALRELVEVVPFGLPADPPEAPKRVLKGVVDGIGENDRVLLWGGGIWNWFDPLTVIRAVARLAEQRRDVKLYFLGVRHPSSETPEMVMTERAVELARDLDVIDRSVFFNFGWVPYQERAAFFLEADLGVSAHFDNVETRYAFRTRMLDYLWAGLPIVASAGDVLADLVTERNLGRSVAVGDVDGWVRAISELLDDDAEYGRVQANVEQTRPQFTWPVVVEPLARFAAEPGAPVHGDRSVTLMVVRYLGLAVRSVALRFGIRGVLRHAFQVLFRPRVP
ncbi:MAG: glycosyltransferase [Actinomycetota bacterium]|nr:glycosyltransferase [Actinomycetota bacterium]